MNTLYNSNSNNNDNKKIVIIKITNKIAINCSIISLIMRG